MTTITAQYGVNQYGSSQYSTDDVTTTPVAPFIRHRFGVHSIQTVGVPTGRSVFNQFDEHGSLVSLSRLQGETNWAYKRRILDTFVHIANSSYRGLMNGITRELGFSISNAIEINPTRDLSGNFLAPDPYIIFDGVWLLLYSDYSQNLLNWAIDRHEPGGNFEYLSSLIDFINSTTYFEASLFGNTDALTKSMTIFDQSNRNQISMEFVPQSNKFQLSHKHLVRGTVFFSNRNTFRIEVNAADLVTSSGKYYINYPKGIVTVYSVPSLEEFVRYTYIKYPFCAEASPIILHNINDDNFRVKMFQQILQDDGSYSHGLPTETGVNIINELLSVYPMYLGV